MKKILFILLVCLTIRQMFITIITRDFRISDTSSLSTIYNNDLFIERFHDYMIKSRMWLVHPFSEQIVYSYRSDLLNQGSSMNRFKLDVSFISLKSESGRTRIPIPIHKFSPVSNKDICIPVKRIFENGCPILQSTLSIELAPNEFLVITERSRKRNRKGTLYMLTLFENLTPFIQDGREDQLLSNEGSIQTSPLPVDYVCIPEPQPEGIWTNEYKTISGWVNVGHKGILEIKLQDSKTYEYLNEDHSFRSREIIGWSDDLSQKFFYSPNQFMDRMGDIRDVRVSFVFTSDESVSREVFSTNVLMRVNTIRSNRR